MNRILKVLKNKDFMKTVMVVAMPIMLQQLLTNSVNLLDNLMVGQLGGFAISGVAASNKFFGIATFGTMGIITASSIFIAQFYGAQQKQHIQQSFRYALIASQLITMPFVIAGLLFPVQIASFFNNDPGLAQMVSIYMPFAALTFVPQALSMTIGFSMRSIGKTKLPLYSSIIALIGNAFFNYALIFGHFGFPELKILGAAIGTLIARFLELSFLLFILNKSSIPFKTQITDLFQIEKRIISAITSRGIPLVINEIFWSGGMALLFKFYATRGTFVMSSMSILQTTTDLFFILFGGMAAATTIVVAQPLGRNELEKAKENAYNMFAFAVVLAVIFGVLILGASFVTPNLYNVSNEIKILATNMIRVQGFFFWIYMLNTQAYFTLRAGGDMMATLKMDAGFMWLINLPLVGILAYFTSFNIFVLFIVGQMTDLIKLTISLRFVKQEGWVKNLTFQDEYIEEFI